jgi:hypothetical protein
VGFFVGQLQLFRGFVMKMIRPLVVALLAVELCAGCSHVGSAGGADSDAGSDADIDSDTDIDADTDTDTNTDTDTDTDADTDSDVDCEDGCLIDGICHPDGDIDDDNVCVHCDTTLSISGWSNYDGAACDDGVFCNGYETCADGTCSMSAGDPCTPFGEPPSCVIVREGSNFVAERIL